MYLLRIDELSILTYAYSGNTKAWLFAKLFLFEQNFIKMLIIILTLIC